MAGSMDKEGDYPEGSLNFEVVSRLKEIADMEKDDESEEDRE
jgi:hypothetical protein